MGFQYGSRRILDDISLTVSTGEAVAVRGKSGSGKSTLLSCVLGLITPSRGTIKVDGQVVVKRTAARLRRQKIGMVFQSGELLPELSPLENVIIAGLLGGLDIGAARERATQLLTRLDVPPGDRAIGQFSGGEQQRVAVARALMNRPPLLLADEPTGSLDTETRDHVVKLLHSLPADFECALVVVTHDLAVAQGCDRLANLADGRLAEIRPAEVGSA